MVHSLDPTSVSNFSAGIVDTWVAQVLRFEINGENTLVGVKRWVIDTEGGALQSKGRGRSSTCGGRVALEFDSIIALIEAAGIMAARGAAGILRTCVNVMSLRGIY